jgi:hypothetical protein
MTTRRNTMILPEIPRTWIVIFLFTGLIILRIFGIDTWTTAALSLVVGYITGKHIEQTTDTKYLENE